MTSVTEGSRHICPFPVSPAAIGQQEPTQTTAQHSLLNRICPLLSTRATPRVVRTIGPHQVEMHISRVECPSKLGNSYTRSGKNSARPRECVRAPHVLRVVVDSEMRAGRLPTREECGRQWWRDTHKTPPLRDSQTPCLRGWLCAPCLPCRARFSTPLDVCQNLQKQLATERSFGHGGMVHVGAFVAPHPTYRAL